MTSDWTIKTAPDDSQKLIEQWEVMGKPPIPLCPGVEIGDLALWLYSRTRLVTRMPDRETESEAKVRTYLGF